MIDLDHILDSAFAAHMTEPTEYADISEMLTDVFRARRGSCPIADGNKPTIAGVLVAASEASGIGLDKIRQESRGRTHIVMARHVATYAAKVLTGASLEDIADMTHRDRTTAGFACRKAKKDIAAGGAAADLYREILRRVGHTPQLAH